MWYGTRLNNLWNSLKWHFWGFFKLYFLLQKKPDELGLAIMLYLVSLLVNFNARLNWNENWLMSAWRKFIESDVKKLPTPQVQCHFKSRKRVLKVFLWWVVQKDFVMQVHTDLKEMEYFFCPNRLFSTFLPNNELWDE